MILHLYFQYLQLGKEQAFDVKVGHLGKDIVHELVIFLLYGLVYVYLSLSLSP
jgi:hypothetical protein